MPCAQRRMPPSACLAAWNITRAVEGQPSTTAYHNPRERKEEREVEEERLKKRKGEREREGPRLSFERDLLEQGAVASRVQGFLRVFRPCGRTERERERERQESDRE